MEKMAFTLDGDCEQSNQPMHMRLELALYAEIDPDMSFYSDSSGGRLDRIMDPCSPLAFT